MSFTESIAAARAFGASGEPRPEPNQELLALGAGERRRRPARRDAGRWRHVADRGQPAGGRAQSQVAALVTAAAALATLLLLGPVIALMPQAALAAVVVFYSLELIKPAEFAAIRRVRRIEFRWAVTRLCRRRAARHAAGASWWRSSSRCCRWRSRPTIRRVHVLGRKRGTTVFRARTSASIPTTKRGRAC